MTYTLRPYQQEAVDAAVRFFKSKTKGNAIEVLPTGCHAKGTQILMARPTKSLSLWYQIVGRAIRPSPHKDKGWVVDLCDNITRFGKVEDLELTEPKQGLWQVVSGNKQLTNVFLE